MINIQHYKSILCLNGDLPDAAFFNCGLPIIAADGAANILMKMSVKPHLVIGDLDSIEPVFREQLQTLYHYDQNYCDFQKSMVYLQEQQLLPAIIVGVNGGFIDHVLNNINIFTTTNSMLFSPPICGFVLHAQEDKIYNLPVDTKISLIGIPTAEISSHGLKWDLHQQQLSFPGANSCFNRSILENIVIKVHKGSALILIYINCYR